MTTVAAKMTASRSCGRTRVYSCGSGSGQGFWFGVDCCRCVTCCSLQCQIKLSKHSSTHPMFTIKPHHCCKAELHFNRKPLAFCHQPAPRTMVCFLLLLGPMENILFVNLEKLGFRTMLESGASCLLGLL